MCIKIAASEIACADALKMIQYTCNLYIAFRALYYLSKAVPVLEHRAVFILPRLEQILKDFFQRDTEIAIERHWYFFFALFPFFFRNSKCIREQTIEPV